MRSLVVDDDFICRSTLAGHLTRYGTCDVAAGGRDALGTFDVAHELGQPYDLVCLDIEMPDLSGHEVLREIRRREDELGIILPVRVIMTSAHSEVDQVKTAFQNRSDCFLVKPVRDDLLAVRLRMLGLVI